ncbi:hypothetical protein [Leptospira meyeri]|uniref:hypothetical protein n=1 Tax=Leptospira meyeri TaxID=29508 RepID=UPI0002BFB3E8|nr:hypothetical protein [Leptospira meyeri]EMJ88772.1 hypothetical protein LEP1GSC196_1889 [Leptospira meyeri serovar Semaranga str. Veldrot Semarang 173]
MDEKERKERMEYLNEQLHLNNAKSRRNINLIFWCAIIPIFGFYIAKKIDDSSYRKLAYFCCFVNFMFTIFPLLYDAWKDPY